MGIDNDYDGIGNADDPTPDGGQMGKIMQLMQALAALLQPEPEAAAAPEMPVQPSDNSAALQAMLAKLTGAQVDQAPSAPVSIGAPTPTPGPVDAPVGLPSGTPEDDISAAPTPFKPRSPDAMEAIPETTDSSPTNKPKAPAKDGDKSEKPASKAKGAMSKLAKKRAGK